MPALSVTLNGQFLVSVATEGLDLLDVNVGGDRIGPEPGHLDVTGGSSEFLMWESRRPLSPNDRLIVAFAKDGTTSRPAQTSDDSDLDAADEPLEPFVPASEMLEMLGKQQKTFDFLECRLVAPDGSITTCRTTPQDHGFGFHVFWNSRQPDAARVSLHTYTLEGLASKQNGTYHVDLRLQFGERVIFELAPNHTVERDARNNGARPSP